MASVFPKNPAIDAFFHTVHFTSVSDALSKERLKTLSDALELLRQRALVNNDVLSIVQVGDS